MPGLLSIQAMRGEATYRDVGAGLDKVAGWWYGGSERVLVRVSAYRGESAKVDSPSFLPIFYLFCA